MQSNGTIRGCVSKSGQLSVLAKGKSKCRKGLTAISWSRGGAIGPAGGDLTGSYPNPTIKPDSVTGVKVDESTLGEVPSARTAANASSAANASQLGGLAPSAYFPSSSVAWIDKSLTQSPAGTNSATILDIQGLNLSMDCTYDPGPDAQRIAFYVSNSSSKSHAIITWEIVHGTTAQQGDTAVSSGTNTQMFERQVPFGGSDSGAGTFVYRDDAQAITIPFRYAVSYPDAKCDVSGTATRAGP